MNSHATLYTAIALLITISSSIQRIQCFIVPTVHNSSPHLKTKITKAISFASSQKIYTSKPTSNIQLLYSKKSDEEEEEEDPMKEWKEQYPDLEFIDYNDPEYSVDQGTEETMNPSLTLEGGSTKEEIEIEIEEMREYRRLKNDEYQFETYFQNVWKSGKHDYFGDWTIYDVTGGGDGDGFSLRRRKEMQKVISKASKKVIDEDNTVIVHSEECVDGKDVFRYWPEEVFPFDFRGPQGIMTVGNAYTICDAKPLATSDTNDNVVQHSGPFETMNAEVGLYKDNLRFRLKLSYATDLDDQTTSKNDDDDITSTHPPLFLKSVIVCRESTLDFPNPTKQTSLYESLGAPGGIYDPPPINSSVENQYLALDLEGRATALFPSKIDQDVDDGGWVMTLDWTTDELRYQADRKVFGGLGIKGLYRLELSEVRGEESEM